MFEGQVEIEQLRFKLKTEELNIKEEIKIWAQISWMQTKNTPVLVSSFSANGGMITGYTKHGLNQAIGRDAGKGVATSAILDAVKNPLQVIEQVGGTIKYVGKNSVVVLNKIGEVVTTWATNKFGLRGGNWYD